MRKYIIGGMLALSLLIGSSAESQVSKIFGVGASGPIITLPYKTPTLICTVNCERRTSPSYTDASRMWGGTASCRTSVNGGASWAACTTQPFASGGQEYYAGTFDGNVIGAGRIGASTCIIRRSIDNGTSWTTVYTSPGITCGGPTGGATMLQCFDEVCALVNVDINTGRPYVLLSIDNGVNWVENFSSALTSGVTNTLAYDGSIGMAPPTFSIGIDRATISGGDNNWTTTGLWPVQNQSCWGSYLMGGNQFAMCFSNALGYHIRNNIGTVVKQSVFSGPINATAGTGGPSYSPAPNVIYTAVSQNLGATSPIGIYVSLDNGSNFYLFYETPFNVNGMREGDWWVSPVNQCLYFSGGLSTPVLIRICP